MAYEEKIEMWDEEHREVKEISTKGLDEQLEKIKNVLKKCLDKLEDVSDNYQLDEFEAGLSFRAGGFIITAEGSITLTFKRR